MVADTATHYPDPAFLLARIDDATRRERRIAVDQMAIAERLLGDHMAGNLVLIGAAFQAGLLPLSEAALEQAIRLNAVAVPMNLGAFRLGRLAVADPAAIARMLAPPAARAAPPPPAAEAMRLIEATRATRRTPPAAHRFASRN